MSSVSEPKEQDDGLEAAVDQAIAACGGDTRAAIRALIVANNFWESESSRRLYRTPIRADAFGPTPDSGEDIAG